MLPDKQCRMVLKSGERCRYKAKERGLCGHHRKELQAKKSRVQILVKAGQYASAVTALITLIEKAMPLFQAIERDVVHVINGFLAVKFDYVCTQRPEFGENDATIFQKCLRDAKDLRVNPNKLWLEMNSILVSVLLDYKFGVRP
jgi:hypothetical protein